MRTGAELVTPSHREATQGFSVEEYRSRVTRFQERLSDQGIDVLLATMPEHLNYLTGFDPLGIYFYQAALLAPGLPEPVLLTHKCEKELARNQCWISDIRIWEHGQDPVQLTVDHLRELGVREGSRVGLEMGNWYLHTAWYRELRTALPHVEFVDATSVGQELRMIKSPEEIARMRAAAAYSDIGFATAIENLTPGVRESDLSSAAQAAMTRAGSEYAALPMIVGSGERSGLFHSVPTSRVVAEGDPVMFEITGVASRYNSNIVRTVVAGHAGPLLRTLWDIVTESFWRPFEMIEPGLPVGELDRVSRDVRSDYAPYIPARAGFGMGLAYPPVWLGPPDLLVGEDLLLEPGMVFSMEPSIAQYDGVTVIYGYNILVTEDGAEILHQTPHDLFEVI